MAWYQHTFRLPTFQRGFHLVTHLIEQEVPELSQINIGLAHIFIHHRSTGTIPNQRRSSAYFHSPHLGQFDPQ